MIVNWFDLERLKIMTSGDHFTTVVKNLLDLFLFKINFDP